MVDEGLGVFHAGVASAAVSREGKVEGGERGRHKLKHAQTSPPQSSTYRCLVIDSILIVCRS